MKNNGNQMEINANRRKTMKIIGYCLSTRLLRSLGDVGPTLGTCNRSRSAPLSLQPSVRWLTETFLFDEAVLKKQGIAVLVSPADLLYLISCKRTGKHAKST